MLSALSTRAPRATLSSVSVRFASKKAGGSTSNGRDSNPKYLGVKKFGGERVQPGAIIVRQRGTRFHPGENVGMGVDHTIYATVPGFVQFRSETRHYVRPRSKQVKRLKPRQYISVVAENPNVLSRSERLAQQQQQADPAQQEAAAAQQQQQQQ
eukprot:TRINITY_DN47_c0_g5_i1.p1 TRINITY_DN47_c0_g5~~TRINITY_DN47_c0_g5_i1.p1  ORF type:complete len:154 (+),score=47.05 TRINITY_DN47_c0_g5_i1:77-538(+)